MVDINYTEIPDIASLALYAIKCGYMTKMEHMLHATNSIYNT